MEEPGSDWPPIEIIQNRIKVNPTIPSHAGTYQVQVQACELLECSTGIPVNITVCDIDGPNMHNLATIAGIQSQRQYFILSDNPMCSNLSAYNLTLE